MRPPHLWTEAEWSSALKALGRDMCVTLHCIVANNVPGRNGGASGFLDGIVSPAGIARRRTRRRQSDSSTPAPISGGALQQEPGTYGANDHIAPQQIDGISEKASPDTGS